jgi:oxygen-independent coproporphyrinogen-3 oxidase
MRLLYIHIPFCDKKCNYCAFNSFSNLNYLKNEYINALIKQINYEKIKDIHTIYIGGGTPSTINIKSYEKLFKNLPNAKEITIEANPNATYEWIKEIKNLGVNRISFGVQSFNDKKLSFLGRNHDKNMAINAINNAYKAGIENINLDLIYSTALDSKKLLKNDLKIAFSLPINHISAYSLTIENNSKWKNRFELKKEDEELEIWFIEKIKEKFPQYEISNFGKKSLHNLGYWEYKEYYGIGAGAVGFINKTRLYPHKNIKKYIQNPTFKEIEVLSYEDIKKEKIFLGLRSIVGFEKNLLNKEELKRVELLKKEKKLYEKNGKIYAYDFLLADAISAYII